MIGRLLISAVLVMSLAGCVVGDGIAHVVKLANGSSSTSSNPAAAPSATPRAEVAPASSAPAPVETAPPPAPTGAPRSSISVESLPPPSQ